MTRSLLTSLFAAAAALLGASAAEAVTFQEVARFDVSAATSDVASPDFIGNNPSAVAWNGRQLFVAGFNASGGTNQTAVIEITNAQAVGLNDATFGSAFGAYSTPNLRGYSGLDINGTTLVAAYDDGGSDPNGIQAFDANSNTQSWAKAARGGSGVAFDPGFGGVDSGVAWTTFGSGRRALQDTATGADIYTTADGMIINDTTVNGGSFWRDMDFDPATGDLYARRSNAIIKSTRTGGNSVTDTTSLIPVQPTADFTAGHTIGFLSDTVAGDLLIYNDRPSTAAGQSFANVVNVMTPAGNSVEATFALIGGVTPEDGSGYYDFDFDPQTQTLAVMDFSSRNVHIFNVIPEPASASILGLGLMLAATRCRRV